MATALARRRRGVWVWWRRSPAALFAGVFLNAMQIGVSVAAMPWRVMSLGGGETEVGLSGGLKFGIYGLGCVLLAPRAQRLGLRRLAAGAMTLTVLVTAGVAAAPAVWVLLVFVSANAVLGSLFWPTVMAWLAGGQAADRLNRRMGIFGFCWSSGLIVGNFAGGWLFTVWPRLPFVVAAVLAGGAALSLASARPDRPVRTGGVEIGDESLDRRRFLVISRMGLLAGWMVLGALRYPLAVLLRDALGAGAAIHGQISAGMSLALMTGFFLLGRSAWWHYRLWFLSGALAVTAGMMAWLAGATAVWVVAAAAAAAGLLLTVPYASSIYYGAAGPGRRAASMSLHEILLAIGFSAGSFGGGAIAAAWGGRRTFLVLACVLATVCAAQGIVYVVWQWRTARGRGEVAAPGGEAPSVCEEEATRGTSSAAK